MATEWCSVCLKTPNQHDEPYPCKGPCQTCGSRGQEGSVCPGITVPEKWCKDCGRLVGVGCACGMTFAEKIRHVAIDKTSLQVRYPGQYST